jgi:hypothetical protein
MKLYRRLYLKQSLILRFPDFGARTARRSAENPHFLPDLRARQEKNIRRAFGQRIPAPAFDCPPVVARRIIRVNYLIVTHS